MKLREHLSWWMGLGMLLVGQPFPIFAGEPVPVGGLRPTERPAGAPTIDRLVSTAERRGRAARGVAMPQNGLGFLDDQGAWYTPFSRPGMSGRYDLRGLHQSGRKD